MTRTYQRVQILDFSDLTEEQKKDARDQCDERAEDGQYVIWTSPSNPELKEVLPLENFIRFGYGQQSVPVKPSLFDAAWGMSYWSAYMIKIGKTGEEATLAYCHW